VIRVVLPAHLRTLAHVDGEVKLDVEGQATQRAVLDALEDRYPMLRGTMRDQVTQQRRAFVRFFACEEDLSHELPDAPLPDAVVTGAEPFLVVGAMAGGGCVGDNGGSLVRYMLLIYGDETALDETERQECYRESTQLAHQLNSASQYLASAPLHPTSTAASVRVRDGKRLVTDGPFAETREQLGGYFLIDAKDLDEAIAIAERIPMARRGTVEVRPVIERTGLPTP
jgi:molybdopterin converting factor small subunit